jgi:hypothetical protein
MSFFYKIDILWIVLCHHPKPCKEYTGKIVTVKFHSDSNDASMFKLFWREKTMYQLHFQIDISVSFSIFSFSNWIFNISIKYEIEWLIWKFQSKKEIRVGK